MAVRFVVRSRDGQTLQNELDFPFDQARIVLGRGASADVRIPSPTVSETHASVQLRGNDWFLTDLASRNGTKHNGQRLAPERARKLREGDLVEIGSYVLSFHHGVVMTEPMSAERTAELARRLWREAQRARGIELPAASLIVINGPRTGQRLEIPAAPSRMHIGSHDKCQLILPEPALSRDTLEVVHDLEGVMVRSLAGDAIVQVGGHRFKSRRLRDRDELHVGTTRLLFEEPAQGPIDALKGEPDQPLLPPAAKERTQSVTPPRSAPASRERDTAQRARAPQQSRAPAEPPQEREELAPARIPVSRGAADFLVYALAIAVLLASALALALLLRVR